MRKHLVEYDDVLNTQREIIYKRRKFILSLFDQSGNGDETIQDERKKYVMEKMAKQVDTIIGAHSSDGEIDDLDLQTILGEFELIIPRQLMDHIFTRAETSRGEWINLLHSNGKKVIADKLKEQLSFVLEEAYEVASEIFTPEFFAEKIKRDMLRVIDILWMEHLEAIEGLKEGIGMSVYSQKDPLIEYKNDAYVLFENLITSIEYQIALNLFKAEIRITQEQSDIPVGAITNEASIEKVLQDEVKNESSVLTERKQQKPKVLITNKPSGTKQVNNNGTKKIGRNDPCPCGSGLKYKKCGAINAPMHQARIASKA